MTEYQCTTHRVSVEVEDGRRSYSGLNWSGTPQCALFTMSELEEGEFSGCKIRRVE